LKAPPIFIGDEISAAGFRLAGMLTRSPEPEQLKNTLEWACEQAQLIMITAEYLAMLDPQLQDDCLLREMPVIVIVPDIRNRVAVTDFSTQLRKKLGMIE